MKRRAVIALVLIGALLLLEVLSARMLAARDPIEAAIAHDPRIISVALAALGMRLFAVLLVPAWLLHLAISPHRRQKARKTPSSSR